MVRTQLTPELMTEGAVLIAKLDASGASPDAAMWMYFPNIGGWRLFLADARVGPKGPREVFRSVQKALHALRDQISHLSLEDVWVEKPDDALIKGLRKAISPARGTSGTRFSRSVINGRIIEDAYIYRLRQPAA